MRRCLGALIFCVVLMASTGTPPAVSQTESAIVSLLDREGAAVTSIVDGDQIRLRMEWRNTEATSVTIHFGFADQAQSLAECSIPAGEDSCETAPFHALGWYWSAEGSAMPVRTVTASVGEQVIGSLTISIAPRPIVMVHGYNSGYRTWDAYLGQDGYLAELGLRGFAVGDGQVPGVMNTGSATDPVGRTNSIAVNAAILGQYIEGVQNVTGAQKVDLLVHSMGGLIARYYIDRLMSEEDVAQLIILGSPMGGSACAILPASLGLLLPASLELQPTYVTQVFNQQIVRRRGVPFYALAGTRLLEEVTSPCTPVPSDVVVALESVRAIPMPVEEMPLLHTELSRSRKVFDGFVTHHLKKPAGAFEVAADPPPDTMAPISQQFSKIYTGHVNLGETRDVVIYIDPNVSLANFALYDPSRSLTIRVTGASGQQLELDPVENGVIRIDDPETMVYLGYGFRQPRPGRWVVTLQTTADTPPSGTTFAITAQFQGGALLEVTQDTTIPRPGETVTVRATLTADGAGVPLASASATLYRPDGTRENLEMAVNGNQANLRVSQRASGLYGLEVSVLAPSIDGYMIDRAAFLTFEVQPAAIEIARNQWIAGISIGAAVVLFTAIGWVRRRRNGSHVDTGR